MYVQNFEQIFIIFVALIIIQIVSNEKQRIGIKKVQKWKL